MTGNSRGLAQLVEHRSPKPRVVGSSPSAPARRYKDFLFKQAVFWRYTMSNPLKYVQQVRNEVSKIVWPTRKETMTTTVMVFIMSALVALFFFIIDTITSNMLDIILKLSS